MKKTIISICVIILTITQAHAQRYTDVHNLNSLSIELGKNGLIYNLVFDHKIFKGTYGFRIGAGSNFAKYLNAKSFGLGGYTLIGGPDNSLELGADLQYMLITRTSADQRGFDFVYPDYSVKAIYPSLNLGFRKYFSSSMLRFGFSPGKIKKVFVPGGYVSYGLTF